MSPALLGTAYVLEGSRLGGAVLARTVAPGLPRRFLNAGAAPWRALVAVLDARLPNPVDIAAATDAAGDTFARFERAGVTHGKPRACRRLTPWSI